MISDFAKEKVFWTQRMNLRLVKFIEKRPNIWNPKHPKYTSVTHRDRAYKEFAAKYGNEFTGQAVKDRWTNIRSTFANHLRKMKTSLSNGDVYQVNWHLWDACQFLRKVSRAVKNDPENVNGELLQQEENNWPSEEDHCVNNILDNPSTMCRNIAENLVTIFKGTQNGGVGLDNSKYAKVGKIVTSKLSQKSSLEALKLSQGILDILLLYNRDNPLNPNNFKTEDLNI